MSSKQPVSKTPVINPYAKPTLVRNQTEAIKAATAAPDISQPPSNCMHLSIFKRKIPSTSDSDSDSSDEDSDDDDDGDGVPPMKRCLKAGDIIIYNKGVEGTLQDLVWDTVVSIKTLGDTTFIEDDEF
jgi:hypothetical protein